MPDLEAKAFNNFKGIAGITAQIAEMVDMIESLPKYTYAKNEMKQTADMLQVKHFTQLTKLPKFRDMLFKNREGMWKCIEQLAFAHDLTKKSFFRCDKCGFGEISDGRLQGSLCSNVKCATGRMVHGRDCWVVED